MAERENLTTEIIELTKALEEVLGNKPTADYYRGVLRVLGNHTTGGWRFAVQKDKESKARNIVIEFGQKGLRETLMIIGRDSFSIREGELRIVSAESKLVLPRNCSQTGMEFVFESEGGSRLVLGRVQSLLDGQMVNRIAVTSQVLP